LQQTVEVADARGPGWERSNNEDVLVHQDQNVDSSTVLELAVQRGLLGLGLYAWLMICLFRLSRTMPAASESTSAFSNRHFRKMWPLLLVVYLLNATAVVMNYQFVNAVLFTIAGILAAQSWEGRQAIRLQYCSATQ